MVRQRRWIASERTQPHRVHLQLHVSAGRVLVRAAPEGSNPGSPHRPGVRGGELLRLAKLAADGSGSLVHVGNPVMVGVAFLFGAHAAVDAVAGAEHDDGEQCCGR